MKNLSLIALLLLVNTSFGQIKFYTNNGSVETTSIDTSIDDLKLTVVIPETAKNHESIVIQYEDEPETGDGWNAYYWRKEFSKDYLAGKSQLSFWLKKAGQKEGEFCRGDYCNKLFTEKESYDRSYVSQPLRVQIYGKDFSKMVWENGEQVKKYKFTLLKSADLMIDYGPISTGVLSEGGLFSLEKYKASGDNETELFSNTGQIYLSSKLTTDGGGVSFVFSEVEVGESSEVVADMSGGGGGSASASSDPIEDIKLSIERSLFIVVNERTKRYLPKRPATNYSDEAINEAVYGPMLNTKGAGSNYPKEAKRFDKRAEYVDWKTGKLGNFEGQVLEIPVYKKSQLKSHEKTYRLKEGETGNTVPLKIFVGESDGKYFVSTLAARGTQKLTEEETKFWNHIETTFKIN